MIGASVGRDHRCAAGSCCFPDQQYHFCGSCLPTDGKMRSCAYIGATNFMIRAPFIVEGLLLGLFGAVIPLAE